MYLGEIGCSFILSRSRVAGPPFWGQGVTAWYQSVSDRFRGIVSDRSMGIVSDRFMGIVSDRFMGIKGRVGSGALELRLEEATVLPLECFRAR